MSQESKELEVTITGKMTTWISRPSLFVKWCSSWPPFSAHPWRSQSLQLWIYLCLGGKGLRHRKVKDHVWFVTCCLVSACGSRWWWPFLELTSVYMRLFIEILSYALANHGLPQSSSMLWRCHLSASVPWMTKVTRILVHKMYDRIMARKKQKHSYMAILPGLLSYRSSSLSETSTSIAKIQDVSLSESFLW